MRVLMKHLLRNYIIMVKENLYDLYRISMTYIENIANFN